MDFWGSFWATMAGALAGAVVGAAAAYFFGRDLANRDRANRLADDAARRQADDEARYRTVIPAHVTRIVDALHRYADELRQTPWGLRSRPIGEAPPPPRHTAYAQVMAAIDGAMVDARGSDGAVFDGVRGAVQSVPRQRDAEGEVGDIIGVLVAWQAFGDDTNEVLGELHAVTTRHAAGRSREQADGEAHGQ